MKLRGTGVSVTRAGDNITLNMPGNVTFKTNSSDISADFYPVLDLRLAKGSHRIRQSLGLLMQRPEVTAEGDIDIKDIVQKVSTPVVVLAALVAAIAAGMAQIPAG